MSLIRAGRGLRLKAMTSVFGHPDDYVRVHACVRVCGPKTSSTFTTPASWSEHLRAQVLLAGADKCFFTEPSSWPR